MKNKLSFLKDKNDPWLVLDQSFFALFITYSLIELSNAGSGLIDGLIVSNQLNSEAMAAIGIAHPIFSFSGIFGGMFLTGMQTLCTRELGRGSGSEDSGQHGAQYQLCALPGEQQCYYAFSLEWVKFSYVILYVLKILYVLRQKSAPK